MKELISGEGYSINKTFPAKFSFEGKYLVLKVEENYIILISHMGVFPNHADALYQFMIENKIFSAVVLGGGMFCDSRDGKIIFTGKSSFYGKPTFQDINHGLCNFTSELNQVIIEARNPEEKDDRAGDKFSLKDIFHHSGH